jgi:hypothetical protein
MNSNKAVPGASAAATTSSPTSHRATTASTNHSSSAILLSDSQAALRERFLSLILLAVGQPVTATLLDGTKLEGILHAATPFAVPDEAHRYKFVFHQVNVLEKGTNYHFERQSTAILDMAHVVNVVIQNMRLDSPTADKINAAAAGAAPSNSFRTDTEISAAAGAGKAKGLEAAGSAWTGGSAAGTSLAPLASGGPPRNSRAEALMGNNNKSGGGSNNGVAAAGPLEGNIGGWDQFEANKTLFNVDATYDESLYTTSLDKSKMDAQQLRKAEKIAKEIVSQTTTNIHLAEERGLKLETDYDEEDLYSGVIKSDTKVEEQSQPNKKTATSAPKMNYAAAAAKQTMPPGFNANSSKQPPQTPTRLDVKKDGDKSNSQAAVKSSETTSTKKEAKEESNSAAAVPEEAKSEPASKLKLNPNAKEFSLNIGAKPFSPSFTVADQPPAVLQPQPHMQYGAFDPNTGMPIPLDPNVMHAYMQHGAPMGHPGKQNAMTDFNYLSVQY